MKKISVNVFLMLLSVAIQAQVPYAISYQGLVRNANNVVVANSTVSLRVSIIKTTATGSIVYVETHSTTTDGNGIFTVKIGEGSSSDNFAAINWLSDKYFLKREIDPAGGSNYTISGTTQFLSVPYALYANTAESVLLDDGKVLVGESSGKSSGKTVGDDLTISNSGMVTISSDAVGSAEILDNSLSASDLATSAVGSDEIANGSIMDTDLDKVNITVSGFAVPQNDTGANGQLLSNVADPNLDMDAATKAYVDDLEDQLNYLIKSLKEAGSIPIQIGDYVFGGVVAYVLQSGDPGYDANQQHGIIVAVTDQSNLALWGCLETTIAGADGAAIGTGMQNTLDIVAGCATAGIAARLCHDLNLNGYTDWYLPSKDELNLLYLSKSSINASALANGGTAFVNNRRYWSSTEKNSSEAWIQNMSNGDQLSTMKTIFASSPEAVRAVRSF
ncbi:MAG: DUF1566 domain-containing protein [Imperialibacter sp.]|uniref:Lcl C-terminal domain-containing protein n=1 Tax=Imperialibacter sp. TaxID=2038411 RepID=UPI0032ED88CE